MKLAFAEFVEKTATEKDNLFYGFTVNGGEILCREAYGSAEGLLAHLENVAAPLSQMFKVAGLIRVELHGPAGELEKVTAPMSQLNPPWFTLEASLRVESRITK